MVDDAKTFLITGFVEYCGLVLRKVGEILGSQPLVRILNDTQKVLGYVKKYQAGSREKSLIVNEMQSTVASIQSEFNIQKQAQSKGGLFSLFR